PGFPQGGADPGAGRRGGGAPRALPALLLGVPVRGELPSHAPVQDAAHLLSQRAPRPDPRRAPGRAGARLTYVVVAGAPALRARGGGSLTADGGVAAAVVGSLVLVGTGWSGGAVLAAFFVSSSVVGRLTPAPPGSDAKGERRDRHQVVANGGPAAQGA